MKKKLLSVALSACLAIGLAVPAFAAESTSGPWITAGMGEGETGTAVKQDTGWYLLKGDAEPSNMQPGPRVSLGAITEGADLSKGYTTSVTLDLKGMKAGDAVAWHFGVTAKEENAYLDEADFHFEAAEDGKPQLTMIVTNGNGQDNGQNKNVKLETPVAPADGKFAITAKFAPDANGKLEITFIANGTEVGKWSTKNDYAKVKGPRSAWLFQCCTEAGVLASLPSVNALGDDAVVENGGGYGTAIKLADGGYRLFGDTTPDADRMTGPFFRTAYEGDITKGFQMSAKLDLSDMVDQDDVAWSFGVTNIDKDEVLAEASYRFFGDGEGKAKLTAVGVTNETITLETPIVADTFEIAAQFAPDANGKLMVTFIVNGEEIAEKAMAIDYAKVKGPRYGWAFQCTPAAGVVLVNTPAASEIPDDTTSTPDDTTSSTEKPNTPTGEAAMPLAVIGLAVAAAGVLLVMKKRSK